TLAALLRQQHLPVTLTVARPVFLRARIVATMAGDTFLIVRRLEVFRQERMAAGAAQLRIAFLKAVLHRDALVEDEALAFPQALFRRDFLEILQDAAFEVVDLLDADRAHVGGRLLAANAAGA